MGRGSSRYCPSDLLGAHRSSLPVDAHHSSVDHSANPPPEPARNRPSSLRQATQDGMGGRGRESFEFFAGAQADVIDAKTRATPPTVGSPRTTVGLSGPHESFPGVVRGKRRHPGQGSRPYCTICGRANQTWFVRSQLLGYPRVRLDDGSWAEWGQPPRRAR